VQNVKEFERLVDGLYVKPNIDVYITGSNAYLLSSELGTLPNPYKTFLVQTKIRIQKII